MLAIAARGTHTRNESGAGIMGKNHINAAYGIVLIPFWAAVAALRFTTPLLLARGFSNSQVGVITSLGFLVASTVQPLFASWVDRSVKFTLVQVLTALSFFAMAAALLTGTSGWSLVVSAFAVVSLYGVSYLVQPITTSTATFFINTGEKLNYGVMRGMGSLVYAGSASIMGHVAAHYSQNAAFFLMAFWFLLMFAGTSVLRRFEIRVKKKLQVETGNEIGSEKGTENSSEKQNIRNTSESLQREDAQSLSLVGFALKYKHFMFLLAGVMLMAMFHNMLESYMYVIMSSVGGNEATSGNAFAIAGICELPPMFLIVWLMKYFSTRKLVMMAAIGYSLKALFILLTNSVGMIYFAMIFQMTGYALHSVATVYYINELISRQDQVKGQTLMFWAFTVGGVTGSFIGGILIDFFGIRGMVNIGVIISVIGTAIVLLNAQDTEKWKNN